MSGMRDGRIRAGPRLRRVLPACVCAVLLLPVAVAAAPRPNFVRYADPDKQFSIDVPAGWQIKRSRGFVTVFYLDDPDDGTGLSTYVPPPATVTRGEITAAQFFETYLHTPLRKRFPDYAVTGQQMMTLAGIPADTLFVASVSWTSARHSKLRGFIKVAAFKDTDRGTTWVTVTAYPAPAAAFAAAAPILDRMLRSLKYGPGR